MCYCVNQALEKWHQLFGSALVIHIEQKKPKNPTPTHPKEQKVGILDACVAPHWLNIIYIVNYVYHLFLLTLILFQKVGLPI
jgi:hypothetical protein